MIGADKWRNPAHDLPTDFEERRVEHYGKVRKSLDPTEFVEQMREAMRTEFDVLHAGLPKASWLEIAERKQGAIKPAPLPPTAEPRNLLKLKSQVQTRRGVVPLIDMVKEAVLRTGCLRGITSVADRGSMPKDVLPRSPQSNVRAFASWPDTRGLVIGSPCPGYTGCAATSPTSWPCATGADSTE